MTSRARARSQSTKRPRRTKNPRKKGGASANPPSSLAEAKRRRNPTAAAIRWNPDQEDVQRSVVKLVLTLVELLRKLMERQAIRRMEQRTLSASETDAIGVALMEIERTIRDIGRKFDIAPEDLNLDLGGIKLL